MGHSKQLLLYWNSNQTARQFLCPRVDQFPISTPQSSGAATYKLIPSPVHMKLPPESMLKCRVLYIYIAYLGPQCLRVILRMLHFIPTGELGSSSHIFRQTEAHLPMAPSWLCSDPAPPLEPEDVETHVSFFWEIWMVNANRCE